MLLSRSVTVQAALRLDLDHTLLFNTAKATDNTERNVAAYEEEL